MRELPFKLILDKYDELNDRSKLHAAPCFVEKMALYVDRLRHKYIKI